MAGSQNAIAHINAKGVRGGDSLTTSEEKSKKNGGLRTALGKGGLFDRRKSEDS